MRQLEEVLRGGENSQRANGQIRRRRIRRRIRRRRRRRKGPYDSKLFPK